ncbi:MULTISPECIES: LysR family transcriptional regulator [Pseudomonas]|jgi:DNA-binding transcriptional LysR family regulator|uniref:LysR family transcriptional regulator n=1 Tax=Pseudomonas TaxID=286 RepID=UPI001C479AAA|nr:MULTISPECIES: LysR family transcriptional regulator [Pseudomonas]QXN51371.1 LysR family transcriptional regulator [Pseudomonas fluorescens]WSO25689.1 LysR family transcriptional regulator [Pseudomonas fluorescens]
MKPTIRQLQHFIALADTGQVSKSALRCHISQSSMTASLQSLEKTLETQLFYRQASGTRLTPAGLRFLRNAQNIMNALDEAVEDLHVQPTQLEGTVRIGLTETISAYLIGVLLPSIERKFPMLEVVCEEHDRKELESRLRKGELDFAIMLTSNLSISDDLEYEVLVRSTRQLWAHPEHPLIATEQISLQDVAGHNYILLDMDEHISTLDRYWSPFEIKPKVRLQSRSIEAVRSLVAAGQGVSILSDFVYRPWSLEGQRISRRMLTDKIPTMDIGIVWSSKYLSINRWVTLVELIRSTTI